VLLEDVLEGEVSTADAKDARQRLDRLRYFLSFMTGVIFINHSQEPLEKIEQISPKVLHISGNFSRFSDADLVLNASIGSVNDIYSIVIAKPFGSGATTCYFPRPSESYDLPQPSAGLLVRGLTVQHEVPNY